MMISLDRKFTSIAMSVEEAFKLQAELAEALRLVATSKCSVAATQNLSIAEELPDNKGFKHTSFVLVVSR